MTTEDKIEAIAGNFANIMKVLGVDLTDDSTKDTPRRVAKMYVNELCSGMHNPIPKATNFENKFGSQMVVVKKIRVNSLCEHHWLPIVGVAYVGYIPKEKVLGLSKFNRIVDHFARKPQIQERLINEIGEHLKKVLETEDLIVTIKAAHYCTVLRGIRDTETETINSFISGTFEEHDARAEFFKLIEI
jgi:GTP cyclohydrolase I